MLDVIHGVAFLRAPYARKQLRLNAPGARPIATFTVLPLMAVLLAVVMASPANASCAAEPEELIASKETVFVATVLEQNDRYARVQVEEIWRGPALAPSVWLRTAADEAPWWPLSLVSRSQTSVDAQLVPGARYVIATEGAFRTNTCLVAEASEPFVERLAPDATRAPVAFGDTGAEPSVLEGPAGVALALLGLVTLASTGTWLAYRRLRPPASGAAQHSPHRKPREH